MAGGPWRSYNRFAAVALPLAALLAAGAVLLKSRPLLLAAGGLAGLAVLPWALILAALLVLVAFCLVALPIGVVVNRVSRFRKRKESLRQLGDLDRLDPGDEAGVKGLLEILRPAMVRDDPSILGRVRNPGHPFRLALMEFVSLEILKELARRADDPLGPVVWRISLGEIWRPQGQSVRSDLHPAEIEKLWRRALASPDPFALPPELKG